MSDNQGPPGSVVDAPRPRPLPTRGTPAHAAPDNKRVRALLYATTVVLIVIAGIVWIVGRDGSESTTVDTAVQRDAVDVGTAMPTAGVPAAADDVTDDATGTDEAATDDGVSTDTDETATDDGMSTDTDTDPTDTTDTALDASPSAEPEATTEPAPEPTATVSTSGPQRSNPATEIPDDAPADVADSIAAGEAGEVVESRGIVLGGRIFLVGAVPSQQAADDIVATASEVLGPDNVYDYYFIDERAGDPAEGNVRVDDQVLFETGSAVIAGEFEPLLGQALALMILRPNVTLTVVGHTDDIGAAESNQVLSEQRAQAVADWLTVRGIDPSRLTVEGRGESDPIADNDTPEGREANRRIEVFIENLIG